ncbi:MAG: phytanoyl-CoA dioxygenase family protein [Candidatus Latescibacterota bacterium]|jgi:ectoine hydroxylase-related dioxygenase (phytanoyl-CoA dioxygenase family)|tara:strand:- start:109 stop:912 length:804 start_codon:yes stop_codon:yes gene_type:complete
MITPLPLVAQGDLQNYVRVMEEDGFAYFPGVLDEDEIIRLRRAMDELTALPESYDRDTDPVEHGFMNKSINNAFNRDPVFVPYLDRPEIIDLVEEVLGADCHCLGMTAWVTGPGRPDQTLHADWQPLTLPEDVMEDPRVKIPIFISTAHFYLDDIYEELGPTNFVPGSHRAGRRPNAGEKSWKGVGEQSIMCKAGDAVLFRSEVWHRGTANTSEQIRYLLQVHYSQRIITQKLPPYLNKFQFDKELLERATPRQLRLLGDHTPSNYD